MPPIVYHSLLNQYLALLASFFGRVAAPIEAPEKTSFGDIDVVVAEPKATPFHPEAIATAVNAKRTISSNPLYSFAVAYPDLAGTFVQLDIHLCEPTDFDWEIFHKSHGDLWNLLGSSIRRFGFTANDKGLHLRIPEIEEHDRKKSLVPLTAEPDTVLDFLRLDRSAYAQPFDSVEDMFEFACSTRFFRPDAYVKDGLKANDRKRMAQRDLYRRFVDDFVPKVTGAIQENGEVEGMTRAQVLAEALERFGKRHEYEARVKAWRKEREELAHKQEMREWRKAQAMNDTAYADAWIDVIQPKAKKPRHSPGAARGQSL
ncbi:MAG: hypothetical protein LQ338_002482 [Usnochroma carphineum]|nr:MAG: hypothetical protein LQ338_002482 [Usnochroma carphineum]